LADAAKDKKEEDKTDEEKAAEEATKKCDLPKDISDKNKKRMKLLEELF